MKKTIEKSNKSVIAYHEAGHVLLNLLANVDIIDANIIEDRSRKYGVNGFFAGAVSTANSYSPYIISADDQILTVSKSSDEITNDVIKCSLAGALAEERFCEMNRIEFNIMSSCQDLDCIIDLFDNGETRFKYKKSYWKHASKLTGETKKQIEIHWEFIEIIAMALLSNNCLTGNKISKLWTNYKIKESL
jgi:hypothetical protein